jgi:hypothetical protein
MYLGFDNRCLFDFLVAVYMLFVIILTLQRTEFGLCVTVRVVETFSMINCWEKVIFFGVFTSNIVIMYVI